MRALVVDDSRAIRRFLANMLVELGWEVVEAEDGVQALEMLDEHEWSLALIDWNMPEMDGLELLQEIRARSEYDELPVMMVTSESDSARVTCAMDAGAGEFLMKPFTKDSLLGKLQILGLTD